MQIKTEKVIDAHEWSRFITETYGRPYEFQQQAGCRERGLIRFSVPGEAEDYEVASIPEIVNHEEMGVSFAAWLERDPKKPLADGSTDYRLDLWWARNFYPELQMIANDLHTKKLLQAGEYAIDIDW